MKPLLDIQTINVSIDETTVLKDLSLTVREGEIHAIMGPNGSGKSSLAHAIIGDPRYSVTSGDILYKGSSLLSLTPTDRARSGIFLSFQNPVEIAGVTIGHYLRLMYEARHGLVAKREPGSWQQKIKHEIKEDSRYSLESFRSMLIKKLKHLSLSETLLERSLNEGFSGGEKKKFAVLEMMLLEPELIVLDEIDSGLDVDALTEAGETIMKYKKDSTAVIVITHYSRILKFLKPSHVHVLQKGKLSETGGLEIVTRIDTNGYAPLPSKI